MDFALVWQPAVAAWCLHVVEPKAASASAFNVQLILSRAARNVCSNLKSTADRLRTSDAALFTAAYRLRHKEQFDLVYREGRRFSDVNFLILSRPNTGSHARLGLSIAAKAVGNAVNRNRIKRTIRESFRHRSYRLPAVDIVVNARSGAKTATNAALTHSLEQLWDKLARYA